MYTKTGYKKLLLPSSRRHKAVWLSFPPLFCVAFLCTLIVCFMFRPFFFRSPFLVSRRARKVLLISSSCAFERLWSKNLFPQLFYYQPPCHIHWFYRNNSSFDNYSVSMSMLQLQYQQVSQVQESSTILHTHALGCISRNSIWEAARTVHHPRTKRWMVHT